MRMNEAPFANIKMECQRWPEMPLILGRSGTQCVAMVTKLLSWYCGAHLVESYSKESNIFNINWLWYLFSSYLIKIWLSIWCHHWTNLHILKTWISLERKEILENSKQHFSSHTGYLFMRQVQKSDRINLDRQSGSDQLGSTQIVSDYEKKHKIKESWNFYPFEG